MKSKTFVTSWIAAAVLALGSSAAVQAQSPAAGQASAQPAASAPAKGPRGEHRQRMDPAQRAAKRAEMQAKREADFKQKLNLTAAQQGAWTQYTAAMKPPARPMPADRDARKAERDAFAKMSTPQRIDAMEKRHAEMAAHMKARGDATKAFYAQLNPAQQKTFDAEAARRFEHRGERGGHGHGPRGERGEHGKHPGHGRHGQPGPDGKAVPAAPAAPAAPTK